MTIAIICMAKLEGLAVIFSTGVPHGEKLFPLNKVKFNCCLLRVFEVKNL